MPNDAALSILSGLEVAAFERGPDGSFTSIGTLPDWFAHLGRDQTFPFLGTFLEEAREHWDGARTGRLRSGPCVEIDDAGREFHFEVSALAGPTGQFLVFERPAGVETMRAVLQKAREQALDFEARERSHDELGAAITTLRLTTQDARRHVRQLVALARTLAATPPGEEPSREAAAAVAAATEHLLSLVDVIVETARLVTQRSGR